MTINELDQGIRNLIATQPMAVAGPNGEVVNGINSLIDAYRNLCFRVQSYPCQDVLKFGLSNEVSKLESTITGMACQVLQERGINVMLYVPRTGNQYGPMVNGFGMINTAVDPNVMLGQMVYATPMAPQAPMMQMPNAMMQPGRPMPQPAFNMQPSMTGLGVPNYNNRPAPKHSAPTFPGYSESNRPVRLEPTAQTDQGFKTQSAPQSKIKAEPKVSQMNTINKVAPAPAEPVPEPIETTEAPNPAEMLMGGGTPAPAGKAQGRDYLMELLKK